VLTNTKSKRRPQSAPTRTAEGVVAGLRFSHIESVAQRVSRFSRLLLQSAASRRDRRAAAMRLKQADLCLRAIADELDA
jgi:hypothetical protein